MAIVDSHFHWWPRSVFEALCKREGYPRAAPNGKGGYLYWRRPGEPPRFNADADWFDLDAQLAHMDRVGKDISAVSSLGPLSIHFSDLPAEEGREAALHWNEEMAWAQRKYPGRVWGTAAVPLIDTRIAVDVLDHAIARHGLVAANLPSSIGDDARIDAERLEPFYDRVTRLGVPLYLHPTDAVFPHVLEGYDGALHLTIGRVIEVSVAASRLILSGIMERFSSLKIIMSHTGGFLPYQAGRLDKNSKKAKLPQPASAYIRRMYTDTVSPHIPGIKFAIEFYGADHVMYGSDYPCWNPATALQLLEQIGLSAEDREKVMNGNARRVLRLQTPVPAAEANVA
jgi:aminocarboxymuconate-semialdehyde decarboxylase